jgi:hypothetical protein
MSNIQECTRIPQKPEKGSRSDAGSFKVVILFQKPSLRGPHEHNHFTVVLLSQKWRPLAMVKCHGVIVAMYEKENGSGL